MEKAKSQFTYGRMRTEKKSPASLRGARLDRPHPLGSITTLRRVMLHCD
jgi:hypothetical protein